MPKFRPKKPFELYKGDESDRKNRDSAFISGIVKEQIEIGGVPVYIWAYEGTWDQFRTDGTRASQLDEKLESDKVKIQDVVFGENRDRKYADDAVRAKGVYTVSQNALDFARFGLMISDDIIQMEFHKEDLETLLGRRLIVGDVVEMPHLRDVGHDGRPNNRFYEVQSIVKSPGGFDPAYRWHVMAATMRPIKDAQEFVDLMEREDHYGVTLRDQLSDRANMEEITAAVQEAAIDQAYTTWFDTSQIYIDKDTQQPYRWYDDGLPPNGEPVTQVSSFPLSPNEGDYVLRTDMYPKRLYRYQAGRWLLKEVDRKREWGTYNWTAKLREFATDQSESDDLRPWEYKSIHDVATPRHDISEPSPRSQDKGGYIDPPALGSWQPLIVINTVETENIVTYEVTLAANTGAPIQVDAGLEETSGAYKYTYIEYTVERGASCRIGEMVIADDGTNAELQHEFVQVNGGVDITFTVGHDAGTRYLRYSSSAGAAMIMRYRIKSQWS